MPWASLPLSLLHLEFTFVLCCINTTLWCKSNQLIYCARWIHVCKQKPFELVIEGIFDTFLHLPALDSVLRWHLEALLVTYKYWVVFSSQLHSRLNECIYLFIFNLGNLFPLIAPCSWVPAWPVNSDAMAKLVQFPPSSAASKHPPDKITTLFSYCNISFQGSDQSMQSHWKTRLEFFPPWLLLQVSHLSW